MNLKLSASGTIDINVSATRVWEVLTNPSLIKEYLFGTETTTDWKVGSPVVFQGDWQGHKYEDHGIIQENILHKRISYTYWSSFFGVEDKPENYSVVTLELSPKGEHVTTFAWTMKGFLNEERQKHSQDGMKAFLEQIKGIAER